MSSDLWDRWKVEWPLPNVWLGVSVEDQKTADDRIPLLLDSPAAIRFISAEPLLDAIDLTCIGETEEHSISYYNCLMIERDDVVDPGQSVSLIDWVIAGGESGPGARPIQAEWIRDLRDQCNEAKVPFFFKQWGGRIKKKAGRELDGREWNEFPNRTLTEDEIDALLSISDE